MNNQSIDLPRLLPRWSLICLCVVLMSCGQRAQIDEATSKNSTGQVSNKPSTTVTYYAAARFADQVSFGATPALIDEISKLGFEAWIDAQMALPATVNEVPRSYLNYKENDQFAISTLDVYTHEVHWQTLLTAPDQLRQRVAWSIFEFIPTAPGQSNGQHEYYNLIISRALDNYGTLLHDVSIHPMMGFFLNNDLNRPSSPQCLGCVPNENYARELMQLFSLGVVQLNTDGSTKRDAHGKPLETYTQKDVEELARALTGWRQPNNTTGLPDYAWPHFGIPMVPESAAFFHDSGAKTVMGTAFAAGMNAPQELNAVIAMLMKHPNIAPFVSLRLIQHLVTSNPSPQYLTRIATVFRNNGNGVTGDLKAVVRAILLDPEARAGDQIGSSPNSFGKLREPVQWWSAMLRGMNCKKPFHYPANNDGIKWVVEPQNQNSTFPSNVFSYYQATDRAPGSNLLAPEQKLLNTNEFITHISGLSASLLDRNYPAAADNYANSGCEIAPLGKAFAQSPKAIIDLISQRWFRGAMPPTLRENLQALIHGEANWNSPEDGALTILQVALSSPYFGVIK
ncbi:DUF1800 domain-containing protein [Undibacterium flavidum]|uniref:DUF1800 domain-containing protein n=1 Tax=Undibacterium flavidum TaxID=2762297 RepID=A0ABR6YC05_9BURK|nr:DUF1800 family protein [Undibacterium flavidum]MBC3874027.1 DUF1800 domain-containing protein [Undibacterium flavidum]